MKAARSAYQMRLVETVENEDENELPLTNDDKWPEHVAEPLTPELMDKVSII